jgi:hypothetical protein
VENGERSKESRKEEKGNKERRYPNSRARPPRSGVATEAAWLNGKQFGKRRSKEKERKKQQNDRKALTLTGLLMEGV